MLIENYDWGDGVNHRLLVNLERETEYLLEVIIFQERQATALLTVGKPSVARAQMEQEFEREKQQRRDRQAAGALRTDPSSSVTYLLSLLSQNVPDKRVITTVAAPASAAESSRVSLLGNQGVW